MVLLKMLMKIGLPKMRGLLVMTIISISPSGREVPPAESLRQRAKVLLPKFCLKMAVLHPESPLLLFIGQKDLYTRRGAPEVGLGEHNPPGPAWAPWLTEVGCAHLVGPFGTYLLQYSSNIP